jgi:PadR family transcriptional regulator AphA
MTLRYILLGFLNYGPLTGYEAKKLFDTTVAHFWGAELSQIYPTLKQLESEGLAAMEVEVQEDKPNRKVYTITEDGHRELLEWLATPAQVEQVRDPLLARTFFGAALSKDALMAVLRQRADELERAIAEHERAPTHAGQFADAVGLKEDGFFWTLTVDAYIARMRGELVWLKGAIKRTGAARIARSRKRGGRLNARSALAIIDAHLGPGPHAGPRE